MRVVSYFMMFVAMMLTMGFERKINSLKVTASAYTSNAAETDSNPSLVAWGDTLKPGMKAMRPVSIA